MNSMVFPVAPPSDDTVHLNLCKNNYINRLKLNLSNTFIVHLGDTNSLFLFSPFHPKVMFPD